MSASEREVPNDIPETPRTTFAQGGLGHAAITYAKVNWPVFRLQPGTKIPYPGSRGFMDATTDINLIFECWSLTPMANVAIRTGVMVDVLDVDVRADGNGFDALERLQRAGLLGKPIARASTRNGGLHHVYATSGSTCRSWKVHHVDLKAAGGYIVAPPSVVPCDDGVQGPGKYTWLEFGEWSGSPLDVPAIEAFLNPRLRVVEPSDAGFDWSAFNQPGGDRGDALVRWVAKRAEGERNAGLYWAAKRAELAGVMTADLKERLVDAAVQTGQTRREAEATVASGIRNARRATS